VPYAAASLEYDGVEKDVELISMPLSLRLDELEVSRGQSYDHGDPLSS